jgi:plasmid stability protein
MRSPDRTKVDPPMASITIRNLAPATKERLRVRAAQRGHSMEAEARAILQFALEPPEQRESLADIMRELFGPEHGVELQLPPREQGRDPPSFE